MGIFNRVYKSIFRNFKRSVILFSVVAVLMSLMAGALLVREASNQMEVNLRRRIPTVVTLGFDSEWSHQHWLETGEQAEWYVPWEVVATVGALPYVENFYFTNMLIGNFRLEHYFPLSFDYEPDWLVEGQTINFFTWGLSQPQPVAMEQGLVELVEGRYFTDSEILGGDFSQPTPVLISRSLANQNQLGLGSIITNYNNAAVWYIPQTELEAELLSTLTFDLEVIGIFDMEYELFDEIPMGVSEEVDRYWVTRQVLEALYVPIWFNDLVADTVYETLVQAFEGSEFIPENLLWFIEVSEMPVFSLGDPLYLVPFLEAAEPLLPEGMVIEDLSVLYRPAFMAMDNFRWISQLILIGSGIAVIVILSLLITLFLSDRKQEIGIYLAQGEKKGKIVLQFLLETLAITFPAFLVAFLIGGAFSSGLSQNMLERELTQIIEVQEDDGSTFGAGAQLQRMSGLPPQNIPMEELVSMFEIDLSAETVMVFWGLGTGVVLLATLVPIVYVMRLSPKRIMLQGKIG